MKTSRSQPCADVSSHARTSAEPSAAWRPIATAPRDRTIVVWHAHESDPYFLEDGARLTVYGAHMEGLSCRRKPDGVYMAQWGGEWDDAEDGFIPNWWFAVDTDWEQPLAPTHWQSLVAPLQNAQSNEAAREDASPQGSPGGQ